MFRFFRSIRQQLLLRRQGSEGHVAENKTVRYLKYAVGEIFLIMIGIFLALQLNNWNEGRKDRIEEREILSVIKSEIEMGVKTLPRWLDNIQLKLEALARVADAFKGDSVDDHKAFLTNIADACEYGFGHPTLRNTSFEEYKNSGKLSLIQNRALRENIIGHYRSIESQQVMYREGKFANLAIDLVPFQEGSTQGVKEGLRDIEYASLVDLVLQSELANHITREVNRAELLYRNWSQLKASGTELIFQIEAELN